MPLTPTDVANKQFRIAFRGYSLDEVDAFLDEVETELTRLLRDNAALQERAGAPAAAAAAQPVAAAAPAAPLAGMEGQEAALRTLLLAQRTADEAIAEARGEAEQIVAAARAEADATLSKARAEAESTVAAARTEADRTLSSAQEKAARVDQDVAARIQAATGDLDVRRRELETRIEELRAFEREYRTRLKAYLESQLRDLDSGTAPDDGGAAGPGRHARAAEQHPGAGAGRAAGRRCRARRVTGGSGGGGAGRSAARGRDAVDAARRATAGSERPARRPVHGRAALRGRRRQHLRPLSRTARGAAPVAASGPPVPAATLHAPLAPPQKGPTT